MNDKSVSVLENYELEVSNIVKGRSMFICHTKQGKFVLEEYKGAEEKLPLLETLLMKLWKQGFEHTDMIVRNKEGKLYGKDYEGNTLIVKKYIEGRECSVKNKEDLILAIKELARLHNIMNNTDLKELDGLKEHSFKEEVLKHNRELKHVRSYIRKRTDKSAFERALLKYYQMYLSKALELEETIMMEGKRIENAQLCHGDYQYHNVIFMNAGIGIINFEKFHKESSVKDLYFFIRKVMEKHNWSIDLWEAMIASYEQFRPLNKAEWKELYFRLCYPEKFWKIVNFYHNNRKSWQPEKNLEKLLNVVTQEEQKDKILQHIREHVD